MPPKQAIFLVDDGTMDTVFQCSQCGETLRYSGDAFERSEDGSLEDGAEGMVWEDHMEECSYIPTVGERGVW